MPGGTAFYCSHAIRHFNDIDYALITAVGATEIKVVEELRETGINVTALPSKHSVYFENIYGENPDDRTQRVLTKADPFTASQLREIEGDKETYTTGQKLDTVMAFQPSEFSENPKKIREQLTFPELDRYIDRMKMRGSSNVIEFQIEKYKMIANAFATFILTFIGVSISSRKIRGGMGLHLGIGLLISFSYILFMQFSTVFATNGNMNPLLAVWLPNILFAIIGVFVYRTAPK